MAAVGQLGAPGRLFVYSDEPGWRLTAFHFAPSDFSRRGFALAGTNALVFIGGMYDGLLSADYLPELARSLPRGWALVQPLLSSCYAGFGVSSLDRDAAELCRLLHHLQAEGVAAAALLGFSTGAQDAVHLLRTRGPAPLVRAVVLQSGVSDREEFLSPACHGEAVVAQRRAAVAAAAALVAAGKGDELMPRGTWDGHAPLSAARCVALGSRLGLDDYFSADLTDAELAARLGHLDRPTLIVLSAPTGT